MASNANEQKTNDTTKKSPTKRLSLNKRKKNVLQDKKKRGEMARNLDWIDEVETKRFREFDAAIQKELDAKKTSSNMFISGNLDLVNLNLFLNEISQDKKIHEDELTYIEKEFNDILLAEGYKSFFDFLKLKEFVKIITSEDTN